MEHGVNGALRSRQQSHRNMTRIWTHSFCNELTSLVGGGSLDSFVGGSSLGSFVGGSSLDSFVGGIRALHAATDIHCAISCTQE
jgi:hypothetical protein